MSADRKRLALGPTVAFCLPSLALNTLVAPATSVLPGVYAKYFGLPLATVAVAVLIARLLDGLTDPVIGYLSDRSVRRGGSRKQWVVYGGIASIIAGWMLYSPVVQPTFAYFVAAYILFYVAMTSMDIPHNAWASELSADYQDRTRIFGFKGVAGTLGQLAFFAIPFLPIMASKEITPDVLRLSVFLTAAIMLPSLLLLGRSVPRGDISGAQQPSRFLRDLKDLSKNTPFLMFLAVFALAGLGFGISSGILFIVLDSYLAAEGVTAAVFALAVPTGLIGIPFWYYISRRTSKKITWQIATALLSIAMASLIFLKPGNAANVTVMALTASIFFFGSAIGVLGPSVIGDAADYGTLKSGKDLNATYFALFTAATKANFGLGGALGLAIAGLFGYDVAAETNSDTAIRALMVSFSLLPASLILISMVVVHFFPIDERRHAIILKRISTRPVHKPQTVSR